MTGPQALDPLTNLAFDQAPVALLIADRDLRILKVNARWLAILEMETDVAGRTLIDLFPSWYASRGEDFAACLRGETPEQEVIRFRRPVGRMPWLQVGLKPWRRPDGSVGGVLSHVIDVSAEVEAQERIQQSERRLRLAAEIAKLQVFEVDYEAGSMEWVGDEQLFDPPFTFDQLREDVWATIHEADRDRVREVLAQQMRNGEPFRCEYRAARRDGRELWVSGGKEVLRSGPEGERVVFVVQDITERRQAEESARQARDAAEAANRAKSEFLANMSHEIRTPLNGVMGVASALARQHLTPEQREMVGLIEDSARTLESLLSDVLDLARIESGRLDLREEPFDLVQALRAVSALFEPQARAKGVSFRAEIGEAAEGQVTGDVTRIRQIVSNLLSNAVKFTQAGDVALTLTANRRYEGDGEVVDLTLSVADSGIGFDEETGRRLFHRFEQADGSITRRFGGTGLGLAISRSLAEAMNGTLTAVSTPGEGAVFTLTLTLPWSPPIVEAEPEEAQGADLDGRAPRILLAEDHPVNRRVVELILGMAGVDLVCVENGQAAIDAAEAEAFDLVLMDMQMPVMDGLTAIRRLREREAATDLPRLPILTLTANAMAEHAAASREAGADGHLTKPIAADALLAAVRQMLDRGAEFQDQAA